MTGDEAREFFRSGDTTDTNTFRQASEALKREYAESEGILESRASGDAVQWLLGRPHRGLRPRPRWFDHGTRWKKNGKPFCLVGQPYGLAQDEIVELAELRSEGIEVMIDVKPAWHWPGEVLSIRAFAPECAPSRSSGR